MDLNTPRETFNIPPQISTPINLIDLDDDCKQHIFDHLEWTDLLTLADTSKQLRKAVYRSFNRKHRNAKIDMGVFRYNRFVTVGY